MTQPSRSLPPHPSLEQQQKLAKELLEAFRAGDTDCARARIRGHLPDKKRITLADAQFVLAREYGFESWAKLKAHIRAMGAGTIGESVREAFRRAFAARDAAAVRELLRRHRAARAAIDAPVFSFDSPALVHIAGTGDLAMVEVLLEFGADPNRRSGWWAGGWHALHSATGAVADRLIAAGTVPDACAAAHLDRPELLRRILDADPSRVHERGGDGQTPLHFARSREVVADLEVDGENLGRCTSPARARWWICCSGEARIRRRATSTTAPRRRSGCSSTGAEPAATTWPRTWSSAAPGRLSLPRPGRCAGSSSVSDTMSATLRAIESVTRTRRVGVPRRAAPRAPGAGAPAVPREDRDSGHAEMLAPERQGPMKIFGEHDDNTLAQLSDVASRAEKAALMADGHLGYVMPIGGVAAYRDRVSVVGVGFDIACGNAAIRTDIALSDLGAGEEETGTRLNALADEIQDRVSFGIGRKNRADDAPVDHPLFEDPAWDAVPPRYRSGLREKARAQLGTVGSGNHYVDVFADEVGAIWVGVHFGSRGFGHTVASGFLALGQGARWGERVPEREVLLPLGAPLGHDYWHLMTLAGRYAYAGREWVARKGVALLGGRELELVHNHHNFAWKETHGGEAYVVVRKGATPAFPGQKGFIGGSMGDDAVIVQGAPEDRADEATLALQRASLFSTVHGAGRVMSRTAAAGKRNRKTGEVIRPGRVSHSMMEAWVREKGVVLRGGGLDESPHVYRRLPEVLTAQGSTIEVLHTLRPLIVVMVGANEFDPYRD